MTQLAKASDTQEVGRVVSLVQSIKLGLRIIFRSDFI